MKNPKSIYRKFVLLALCTATGIASLAQKLPTVQKNGIMAPPNVKTDGKATEWGQFAAYNKANAFFYTIANNKDKLYLTVQASDSYTLQKILAGGVTFSIINTNKHIAPTAITFPLMPDSVQANIMARLRNTDANINTMLPDINTILNNTCKEINVKGISVITDTLISVYNEHEIRAAIHIDEQKALTFELAVPLKYLGLSSDQTTSFNYNIKLNGTVEHFTKIMINGKPGTVNDLPNDILMNMIRVSRASKGNTLYFPTDFSGEYTLIKI